MSYNLSILGDDADNDAVRRSLAQQKRDEDARLARKALEKKNAADAEAKARAAEAAALKIRQGRTACKEFIDEATIPLKQENDALKAAAAAAEAKVPKFSSLLALKLNINNDNNNPLSLFTPTECVRILEINLESDPPMFTVDNEFDQQKGRLIPANTRNLKIVFCTGWTVKDKTNPDHIYPIYKIFPYTDKTTFERNIQETTNDKKYTIGDKGEHSLYLVCDIPLRNFVRQSIGLPLIQLAGTRRKTKNAKKSRRKSRKQRKSHKTANRAKSRRTRRQRK